MASLPATQEVATPAIYNAEADRFSLMQRKAQLFAASPLIPDALRAGGRDQALANCYIGLTMAEAMNENPLTVMQNIHIVKGKAGFSAQFMIARANASGVFKGRINWRMSGEGPTLCAEAFATLAETEEEVSFKVDMAMAQAEGWTSNPKYKSVPHLMLRYRSATFLVRLYAPDVMFGYQTAEEVEDVVYSEVPSTPALTGAMLIEQAAPAPAQEQVETVEAEVVYKGQANDGTLSAENPTAAEGPADEQRGEGHTDEDAPPYAAKVTEIKGGIRAAKNSTYLKNVEAEYLKHCVGFPKEVADEIEGLLSAKKRELSEEG